MEMRTRRYRHPAPHADFRVELAHDGQWHTWWRDDDLGGYDSPQAAVENLAGGATYWPSCGNPAKLGLSDDLGDWEASSA